MNYRVNVEEASFHYPQDRRGLEPVSLKLAPGKGLLISGMSGCGKSTLARCLTGLIPHLYRGDFRGKVWINGLRTDETPLWKLVEHSGLVFQNPAFQMLAPTVEEEIIFGLENLGLEPQEISRRLEWILAYFALADMRQRSPHTLSGGEQQKLALASLIARKPSVLVLDEPLSMLDTTSAVGFVSMLSTLVDEGNSLVVCEHRRQYLEHIESFTPFMLDGYSGQAQIGLSEEPIEAFPEECPSFKLDVENLTVEKGGNTILNNLSFSLESGQVVAVVGRNGAGKTTLFRSLMGMENYSGKVTLAGGNGEERPLFGIIFQNPDLQLFNASVREEILYRIENPDLQIYEWVMTSLGLKRYENTPPLLLSEGEKRRVAMATALLRRPRHGVLLDEPALGQDARHKQVLVKFLRALAASGYLVIISTHDLELAAQADRMILLESAGIVADGGAKDIIADEPAWKRIGLVKPDWMELSCSD